MRPEIHSHAVSSSSDHHDDDSNHIHQDRRKRTNPNPNIRLQLQQQYRRLVDQAPRILEQVRASYVVQQHGRVDDYPLIAPHELVVGSLLGVGGYCTVHEIRDFHFRTNHNDRIDDDHNNKGDGDDDHRRGGRSGRVSGHGGYGHHPLSSSHDSVCAAAMEEENDHPHAHESVKEARSFMKTHVMRHNEARYAIKRLKPSLLKCNDGNDQVQAARGMVDLAIEAQYLSALGQHPNIVKMRALSTSDCLDRNGNFFIVMDRLYDTLLVRIQSWKAFHDQFQQGSWWLGRGRGRANPSEQLEHMLVERLLCAYDIASALRYMHENKLVYRDIRQENIGFDVRGDVKVFDFGLSKSLSDSCKARDKKGNAVYGYHLTPRTGSIPYMAPEVVRQQPYDTQCDVYSFAILLWEMLALKPAFGSRMLTPVQYRQRVVQCGDRPPVFTVKQRLRSFCPQLREDRPAAGAGGGEWPLTMCTLLTQAWHDDPKERPNMIHVARRIRSELQARTQAVDVLNRTTHMRSRSASSLLALVPDEDEDNNNNNSNN